MTYDHSGGLARIRTVYGVPAYLGWEVEIDGRRGRIIGHDQAHLILSDKDDRQFIAHPTWKAKYLGSPDRPEDDRPVEEQIASAIYEALARGEQ